MSVWDALKAKLKSYWKPSSLTWLAGMASIIVGVAEIAGASHPAWGEVGQVLAALEGGSANPASLITLGLAAIGLRAKLERG